MAADDKDPRDQEKDSEENQEKTSEQKLPLWIKIILAVVAFAGLSLGAFGITKYILIPQYNDYKNTGSLFSGTGKQNDNSEIGNIYMLNDITVNPLDSKGMRFVVAGFAIEYSSKELVDELKDREPQIRDLFIQYFRRHTTEQLLAISFQDKSRRELSDRLNEMISGGLIDSIYYTKLILQ